MSKKVVKKSKVAKKSNDLSKNSPALKAAKAYMKSKTPKAKTKVVKKIQTQEQKAGAVPTVVTQSLEGVRRIDHLPFKDQMNQIFNPLQAITKTEVKDSPSESTFVVEKKEDPKG